MYRNAFSFCTFTHTLPASRPGLYKYDYKTYLDHNREPSGGQGTRSAPATPSEQAVGWENLPSTPAKTRDSCRGASQHHLMHHAAPGLKSTSCIEAASVLGAPKLSWHCCSAMVCSAPCQLPADTEALEKHPAAGRRGQVQLTVQSRV